MTTPKDIKNNWQNVVTEFHSKSDRAAAILGAAFLEAHLGELITSFFVDACDQDCSLLEADRPLGTFAARVRGAYCMGLISNAEYHDLNLIVQIQYAFANQIQGASFEDAPILEKCFQLRSPREFLLEGEVRAPRQLFVFATALLTQQIAWRALQAEQKRCQVPEDFMLTNTED